MELTKDGKESQGLFKVILGGMKILSLSAFFPV